jgi:hypothetical protein
MPLADAVLFYTNFHRRFGLGDVSRDGLNPRWHDFAGELAGLSTHEARADWTQRYYAEAPDERPPLPGHGFGCFDFDASPDSEIVRLHFYNRDALGPLSQKRTEARRSELSRLFTSVRLRFPNARLVEGRSWLYGTVAYRRLFPDEYVRSRAAIENDRRIQGMARWGQFLDRQGNVKADLKAAFLRNIERLDSEKLWQAFPLPSWRVTAPINVFYAHYGLL